MVNNGGQWSIRVKDDAVQSQAGSKELFSFMENYEQVREIRQAMDHVAVFPGDLHLGGFHFLQSIYNIFYGGLLQPMQAALGWKRIRYADVSQCYKVANNLTCFCREGIEFFCSICF